MPLLTLPRGVLTISPPKVRSDYIEIMVSDGERSVLIYMPPGPGSVRERALAEFARVISPPAHPPCET